MAAEVPAFQPPMPMDGHNMYGNCDPVVRAIEQGALRVALRHVADSPEVEAAAVNAFIEEHFNRLIGEIATHYLLLGEYRAEVTRNVRAKLLTVVLKPSSDFIRTTIRLNRGQIGEHLADEEGKLKPEGREVCKRLILPLDIEVAIPFHRQALEALAEAHVERLATQGLGAIDQFSPEERASVDASLATIEFLIKDMFIPPEPLSADPAERLRQVQRVCYGLETELQMQVLREVLDGPITTLEEMVAFLRNAPAGLLVNIKKIFSRADACLQEGVEAGSVDPQFLFANRRSFQLLLNKMREDLMNASFEVQSMVWDNGRFRDKERGAKLNHENTNRFYAQLVQACMQKCAEFTPALRARVT